MTARTDLGAIPDNLADALRTLRTEFAPVEDSPADRALVWLETFGAVALRAMAERKPGTTKRAAMHVELPYRLDAVDRGEHLTRRPTAIAAADAVRVAEVREVPA